MGFLDIQPAREIQRQPKSHHLPYRENTRYLIIYPSFISNWKSRFSEVLSAGRGGRFPWLGVIAVIAQDRSSPNLRDPMDKVWLVIEPGPSKISPFGLLFIVLLDIFIFFFSVEAFSVLLLLLLLLIWSAWGIRIHTCILHSHSRLIYDNRSDYQHSVGTPKSVYVWLSIY